MKREMIVLLRIELDATRPTGIDAAAEEAFSGLSCNLLIDSKQHGCYGARLISKQIERRDEERLYDIILETTGISDKDFFKSCSWEASQARNIFAYYAKK